MRDFAIVDNVDICRFECFKIENLGLVDNSVNIFEEHVIYKQIEELSEFGNAAIAL